MAEGTSPLLQGIVDANFIHGAVSTALYEFDVDPRAVQHVLDELDAALAARSEPQPRSVTLTESLNRSIEHAYKRGYEATRSEPRGCPECGLVGAHTPRCTSQWDAHSEPRAEGLRYVKAWHEWEAFEGKAADRGSGATQEQMTGAAMMLGWLIDTYLPTLAVTPPAEDPADESDDYHRGYADAEVYYKGFLDLALIQIEHDGEVINQLTPSDDAYNVQMMERWTALSDEERLAAHKDDSYGGCVICQEHVPHTDDESFQVAFPCAVVRLNAILNVSEK